MRYTLDQLSARLKQLTLPVIQKANEAIILNDKGIVDRKKAEHKAGVDSEGQLIGDYRSPSYAAFKQRLNPVAGGKVDLILTGAYVRSLKTKSLGNGQYKVESDDEKAKGLIAKYDPNNTGRLNTINQEVFLGRQKSVHAPLLVKKLRAKHLR